MRKWYELAQFDLVLTSCSIIDVNECLSLPCTNGGTCEDRRASFFCSCPPGLTGETCSEDTDECSPNPCLNSGTCTDLFLDFTCNCDRGYTGLTCDIGESNFKWLPF